MKVHCQKEDLLTGVQAALRAISGKNTLPVLGGIMLTAAGGHLIFRSTDLELAVEMTLKADIEEEGRILVPGKYFADLVRYLPGGYISLTAEDGRCLQVDYDGSSTMLNCYDAEEFPVFPQVEPQVTGTIAPALFRKMAKRVVIAAASDELRPLFTGVYCKFSPDELLMVATDTYRLALTRGSWQGDGSTELVIPGRIMQEIARLTGDNEEPLTISCGMSQVFFACGNITLISRLIGGTYPDYRNVFPREEDFSWHILINRQRFLEGLERTTIFPQGGSANKSHIVTLTWEDEKMIISSSDPELGQIEENLACEIEGEPLTASYNTRYLLDALKVMDGERIRLRLIGAINPGVMSPEEDENYQYLILPLRMD
ncbi:MAG: DNA polymerase III subunit beta [Clostridiales bacterium]|nr:DNA polymerase III subunit beta [Clostridiales bacterium]